LEFEFGDTVRTEQEIRERLAYLDNEQNGFSFNGSEREAHAKTSLRLQMKGLLFALGEEKGFTVFE